MRLFSTSTLLAAVLASCVVTLPFLTPAGPGGAPFAFEFEVTSTAAGHAQLFYDNGGDFNEPQSSRLWLPATSEPTRYRFSLPSGKYRAFRFDPIDRDGKLLIRNLRLLDREGRVMHLLPIEQFAPAHQIASWEVQNGQAVLTTVPGATDPQLLARFSPPLRVAISTGSLINEFLLVTAALFAVMALLLFALDRAARFRTWIAVKSTALARKPIQTILLVSAVAVVVSGYPVIFLGKSHVSPELGTTLLYEKFPTLPNYESKGQSEVQGADIGAIMWQHVPFSMMQRKALLHDFEWPLWNRYNSCGTPLLGQGQSMFGDPLHFIPVLANGAAWAWDLKYVLSKWIFSAVLGLLVFSLTRHVGAALLISLAAPFFGFYVFRLNHPAFFSFNYAPCILYCWLRIAQMSQLGRVFGWMVGLLAANWAMLNSGTAKEAYMLLLCMNFSGLSLLLWNDAPWRERLLKFAALSWTGLIFVLLSAPVWLIFLHTLRHSYTSYNAVSAYQIQPSLLLGLFDEIFYRPLTQGERVFNPSANFVILGGFLYFCATLRTFFHQRMIIALALSTLLPGALAFGLVPPSWIVKVPILSNVAHIDNTFSCALLVLWSVLAGCGFAQAARRLILPEGRGDLIITSVLLGLVVAAWIGFGHAVHRAIYGPGTTLTLLRPGESLLVSSFVWGSLIALVVAVLTMGYVARVAFTSRRLTPAHAIVLGTCFLVLIWREAFHASAVGFASYGVRPPTRVDFHAVSPALEVIQAAQRTEPARAVGLRNNLFPGWSGVYEIEGINGPDALINPWMRELAAASGVERIWDWRLYIDAETVGAARRFLDCLNVRYYLDLKSDQAKVGAVLRPIKMADLDIYESPSAWPRAFFTDRLATYDKVSEFIQFVRAGDGRPLAALHHSDAAKTPSLSALSTDLPSRVVVPGNHYRLTTNRTSFEIEAPSPGIVVLTEAWLPSDIRVELNGEKARVIRVNHAFRGVAIERPGKYQVTFRYQPRPFVRAVTLAALGFGLLGVSGFLLWKRQTRSRLAAA